MHTIQISDALWARWAASPSAMRECLALNAPGARELEPALKEPEPEPEPQRPRVGTLFTAGLHSWCPTGGEEINPGGRAVMMDYSDPGTGLTRSAAFCISCAEQRGWKRPV